LTLSYADHLHIVWDLIFQPFVLETIVRTAEARLPGFHSVNHSSFLNVL